MGGRIQPESVAGMGRNTHCREAGQVQVHEYVRHTLLTWAQRLGSKLEFSHLGKAQQNAHVERYNRTVRYDWLAQSLFDTIAEVQAAGAAWLWTCNNERPNMALWGNCTLNESCPCCIAPRLAPAKKTGGLPVQRSTRRGAGRRSRHQHGVHRIGSSPALTASALYPILKLESSKSAAKGFSVVDVFRRAR